MLQEYRENQPDSKWKAFCKPKGLRISPADSVIEKQEHAGTETGNCETVKLKKESDTVLHIMTNVQCCTICTILFINVIHYVLYYINIPKSSKFLLSDFVSKKGRRAEVHISRRHRQLCCCLWASPPDVGHSTVILSQRESMAVVRWKSNNRL